MAHSNFPASCPSISMPNSDALWDANSDSTLDDVQRPACCFGAPLIRMVKLEYLSSTQSSDLDYPGDSEELEHFIRDEEINFIEEDMSVFDLALARGDGEGADGDPSLRSTSHAYVHHVINDMASHTRGSSSPRLFMHAAPSHPSYPLLVRHLPSTFTYARELALWRYLNDASLRRDPWNPSPPVLSIVDRELPRQSQTDGIEIGTNDLEDEAYIAMDRLYHLQDNPLKSIGDWVDFVRQMLQGLVFLHEHNIAGVSCALDETSTPNIMMDIGLAPPRMHFSRAEFPVKYYFLDFSAAVRLRVNAVARPSRPLRFPCLRGRSNKPVLLSASRPRVLMDPLLGSLIDQTLSMQHSFALTGARARSHSDLALVSSGFETPDRGSLGVDTPKQGLFLSRPSSPDRFSSPEVESGSEEASSDEEQRNVWVVSPITRMSLFTRDLNGLARMLEEAVQLARPVSEALVPIFTAMRQAKMLSLTAEDALRLFENAVRPLDVASVVT